MLTLLVWSALVIGVLAVYELLIIKTPMPSQPPTSAPLIKFEVGTEISEALAIEDGGGVYRDIDGTPMDALDIVKKYGYHRIRARITVDPDGWYGLNQHLDYVLRLARKGKERNLKFLLAFHYSHW